VIPLPDQGEVGPGERSETRRVRVAWIFFRSSEEQNQNALTLVLSLVRERRQNDACDALVVILSGGCPERRISRDASARNHGESKKRADEIYC
jgi:hypothetical protein